MHLNVYILFDRNEGEYVMIIWMDYPYKVALENVRVLHVTEVVTKCVQ